MSNAFQNHFSSLYGERWPALLNALVQPPSRQSKSLFEGFSEYVLDAASVMAAEALPLSEQDLVLDMCAAPGGKTLVLLDRLAKLKGHEVSGPQLIANELSYARRKRLEEVIRTHVPANYTPLVKVAGWDGNQVGIKTPQKYDKILLDAPCSSERHLLEQDPLMTEWKLSRTKQLAQRQYSLLCSAILALKPGGIVVYSTCSISPLENDQVIERVLERKGEQIELDQTLTRNTQHGFQIFPDQDQGQGPIYFSRLIRK